MKRRAFVNMMGGVSAGLVLAPPVASSVFADEKNRPFPGEELKMAIEAYCRKIFDSSPDPDLLAPGGRYFFAGSFEVEVVSEKNSIFDLADEVIEKTKSSGFDASALKEGKIPDGMMVMSGGITVQNEKGMAVFQIEGLKNWDASIIYHNCINILSKVPPREWNKLKKIEPLAVGKGYSGNLKGSFKIWLVGDNSLKLDVESITPSVRLAPDSEVKAILNSEVLSRFLPEKIMKKITSAKN